MRQPAGPIEIRGVTPLLSPKSSLRHWQPCTPFRLHSTYTRPPYPGATPSSSPPLHHLRAFSLLVPIREALLTTSPHYHDCLGVCMHVLTRDPGPPIGVTRLGSPASPRIVPVDAVACRAYRDPGDRNRSKVLSYNREKRERERERFTIRKQCP